MSKTLIFGASGDTGKAITSQALDNGHHVRIVERDDPDSSLTHANLERCDGDLLDGDLSHLTDGIDCVISAVGLGRDPHTLTNPPPLYTEGAVNIVKAMRKTGVKRLVVISAAFADPAASVPLWFRAASGALERIFRQMGEMERVLRVCDDIEWTAVRPGWLLNRRMTGEYSVSLEDLPRGTLRTRREDLAHFMLDCAMNAKHIQERPFIARQESPLLESPPALIEELWPF